MADERPHPDSQLLRTTPLDAVDRLDAAWREHAAVVSGLLLRAADKDIVPLLVAKASSDDAAHAAVVQGLLYTIMTEPDGHARTFERLEAVVRDDLASVAAALTALCWRR